MFAAERKLLNAMRNSAAMTPFFCDDLEQQRKKSKSTNFVTKYFDFPIYLIIFVT